ncbi:MAG: 2-phosphosulfolactate phosphatase [Planctomycetia bacterium]
MHMHWHCHELFNRMPQGAVAGGIAVVIDVLRASTTIISALAHRAVGVRPVPTVDQARALAAADPGRSGSPDHSRILLGGERGGLRIDGFDLANSPLEYSSDRVAGRRIVITTTNGTAALDAALPATEVLIGAIVNRTAVAARARSLAAVHGATSIHLVCAGTDGEITEEDLLAAGAILDAAGRLPGADRDTLDAAATAALERFRGVVLGAADHLNSGAAVAITAAFATSRGGRHLVALGMQADLPAAAAIDSLAIVPRLVRGTSGQGDEAGWLHADAGDSV